MKAGKLPSDLLASLLERLPSDPRLLLGPGIGRDAAAIDLGNGRVLVSTTDPVTFATDQIGRYAVHVNANDVACLGARPAWFMATVLLPEKASPSLAETIFEEIRGACEELGVIAIGGHTEITLGLDRPIIAGAMLGETTAEALVRPDGAQAGDDLVLTKGIAIEGTALLALEAGEQLRARGVSERVIESAAKLLDDPGISVVRDAMTACQAVRVHAMHDPTEGGLATALLELGQASGLAINLNQEDVNILPETEEICRALDLDALGLLASGALLIAVAPEDCGRLCQTLGEAKITATRIGGLASLEGDAIIGSWNQPVPRFGRDELARFLEAMTEESASE